MPKPINIFIIYAREDKEIKQRLISYINPFVKLYNLNIWHDAHIEPGQEWKYSIDSRLNQTDLFVMLVSIDFMNSHFIHQVEFKYAVERHKANKSIIVPVIIRECPWDIDFEFDDTRFSLKELQVLPDEGKPIDDWKTSDHAFNNIAKGIRKVFESIKNNREQQEIIKRDKLQMEKARIEADKKRAEDEEKKNKEKEQEILLEKEKQLKEEQEKKLWTEASLANTTASYNKYLSESKLGMFKEKALQQINELDQKQKEREKEKELWEKTKKDNSLEGYTFYLERHPSGNYSDEARSVVTKLENERKQEAAELARINSDKEAAKKRISKKYIMIGSGLVITAAIIFGIIQIAGPGDMKGQTIEENNKPTPSQLVVNTDSINKVKTDSLNRVRIDSLNKAKADSINRVKLDSINRAKLDSINKRLALQVGNKYQGGIVLRRATNINPGLLVSESDLNNGTKTKWDEANQICNSLNLDGFTGWHLPAYDELQLIYKEKNNIPGLKTSELYWSSSFEGGWVKLIQMSNGYKYIRNQDMANNKFYFRAVRNF